MFKLAVTAFEARVYTADFRVYGLVHLAANLNTAALLNGRRPTLPVTRALLYRSGIDHPPAAAARCYASDFVALPKERIRWLLGGEPNRAQTGTRLESRRVYLLYPDYALAGELQVPPAARISDYLTTAAAERPFHTLFNVEVLPSGGGESLATAPVLERHAFATANLAIVGGLYDVSESREVPTLEP